ncbi:MAG: GUN4 domain-containing protein [Nostoc sp.]|uniref:GUN4 domain-containing protein n=1 Tax=Nostoc sp. TaxID=1180 RepID=UPI002FF81D7D
MDILFFVIVIIIFFLYVDRNSSFITNSKKNNVAIDKSQLNIDESQLNDDLRSSLGIDYRTLRNLLASGSFEEANSETRGIFGIFITGKYGEYSVLNDNSSQMSRIPSQDLMTINDLWFKYSNGLYAFSVQCAIFNEIYNKCEAQIIDENVREKFDMTAGEIKRKIIAKAWTSFRKEVGWTDSDSDISALNRQGNLPDVFCKVIALGGLQSMISLFNRIKKVFFDDA